MVQTNKSNMFDIDRLCFVVCSTKKIKLGNSNRSNNSCNKKKELRRQQQKSNKTYLTAELLSLHSLEKFSEFVGMNQENSHQTSRWLSSCGQNYLHWLCQSCPSVETICSHIELDPNAIKEPDDNGCLPIHIAMTNGASHSVLSLLIEKYPPSVDVRNNWGYPPFHWIVDRCLYELSCCSCIRKNCCSRRREIWRTLELLIMAKAMNENPDRTRNDFKNILLMTFEFSCPVSLTSAILSEFPHLTALKDEQGRVPLATALHVPDNTVPLRALQLLIMVNPYILLERDHDGRNPFHVAIDKDQDWDDMMQLMLLYEPECIRYRDDVTGLYPFMLMATKEHTRLSILYEAVSFCVDMFNDFVHYP